MDASFLRKLKDDLYDVKSFLYYANPPNHQAWIKVNELYESVVNKLKETNNG